MDVKLKSDHRLILLSTEVTKLCLPRKSLPNYKVLHWSKLKALVDDKINVTEKLKFILEGVENIVGKEKMLITSIFP